MFKRIHALIHFITNRFLLKMIVSYSLIIIFMLAVLTFVVSNSYSENLKRNEIAYENQIVRRVSDYTHGCMQTSINLIQQIYSSSSNKAAFFSFLNDTEISIDNYNLRKRFVNMFELAASGDILEIILYKVNTNETLLVTDTARKIDTTFDLNSYEWFKKAGENNGILQLVPSYVPKYILNDTRPVFSARAGFLDAHNKLAGVLIINYNPENIRKAYAEYKENIKGNILVMDQKGSIFFDSTNSYYGSTYPYFNLLKQSGSYIKLNTESVVVFRDIENSINPLIAVGIVPKGKILQSINLVVRTIYFIMSLCIFISIILVYLLSTHFSRRVKSIMKAMKEVESGNLKKRISLGKGNDEIEQINSNFNRMCEKLESYINKVYLAEIKAKDAQLTALQTQINPHFLYNTLEVIRMKAIINNDDEEVSDMIFILSNLFKNSLKNKDMVIRIEDEIKYSIDYLELHKIRYGDRFEVVFDIDDKIRKFAILKLILQPLIENSLAYGGINDNMNSMELNINGTIENETIYISVTDNGRGMEPEELEKVKKGLTNITGIENDGSIGLRNINDRLRIIFGDSYGLDIYSEKGSYTKVIVKLPAKTVEEVRKLVQDFNS